MNSRLASHLHQLGFCQMGFSTAMYGQPSLAPPTPPGAEVSVRAVRADEIDLFLDLYQAGFGLPRLNDVERDAVRTWLEQAQANLELCLAEVDQTPAGVGILYAKNGFGLLADAVTLPAFRGRDCHAALIHYRIAAAARRECAWLTSFVEFGGSSYRNLSRAGLRVAYTKAMWWRVE